MPAGTAAANNVVPVTVTNNGDAPLTITGVSLAAEANDGGNQTRDDFQVVSQNCSGTGNVGPLAAAKAAVLDDPATPDVNEAAPAVPAGTCTVNVGFKPSRTNYTVDRPPACSPPPPMTRGRRSCWSAKSTGDAIGTVGGDVPTTLALSIPTTARAASARFAPTVARSYETAMAATVTSTAGDAALAVTDPSTTAPRPPGQRHRSRCRRCSTSRAINSTNPTQAFAPLAETTWQRRRTCSPTPGPVQRRPRHARLPPGDRRHRRAALRQLQQDADVHAVDDDSVRDRRFERREGPGAYAGALGR